ncbi:MAG: aminotransferase class I/II-fold pyridoxal phosphate-dependent enzyme [Gammaproteobacteria bacterium]|nr:aminotransferase class I/II-fold pyridoxal phosphate-dependent enzyme [Gammaproteobacteria bacterium]MCZ6853030.1 aminotransferase class I/II-fold pyridoxal phosphate-dependent enzyme [Gammaproteobacteria bacterium]
MKYADRLEQITPFRVMELMERAKLLETAGHRVVHFEVGEPDFVTAAPIVAAGKRALDAGETKYTQALGIPELRRRIAEYYGEHSGVAVSEQRVVVTTGASAGLLLLSALLLNPGDELLMADPGYPCNEVFVYLVNGSAVRIPVTSNQDFQLAPRDVSDRWGARTRGILLASPANPTGTMLRRATLKELVAVVHERDGFVILDEIYQGLVYNDAIDYRTGLELSDDLFVLNSFSKYFGMTGWRLGWMVVPEEAVDGLARLAQNLFISPSSIAQHAALAAFDPPAMEIHEARRAAFEQRKTLLQSGLENLGFTIPVDPSGAFYLYVDVSHTALDSTDFCWRLIDEYQVATTPGIDFGDHDAGRYVRFAYTTDEESINLGLARIREAIAAWGR